MGHVLDSNTHTPKVYNVDLEGTLDNAVEFRRHKAMMSQGMTFEDIFRAEEDPSVQATRDQTLARLSETANLSEASYSRAHYRDLYLRAGAQYGFDSDQALGYLSLMDRAGHTNVERSRIWNRHSEAGLGEGLVREGWSTSEEENAAAAAEYTTESE